MERRKNRAVAGKSTMGKVYLIAQSAAVLVMAGTAVLVVAELDGWLGDFGALLWICACFFFPFVAGIALGSTADGTAGRTAGAFVGGIVTLAPVLAFSIAGFRGVGSGVGNTSMLLLTVFPLLGMAQGAITMPVGATVRRRRAVSN